MLRRLSRSLSFRLLIIFLALAASFVYFSIAALRWVYDTDDLRELVSGHLTLHIDYVLDDIGDPPRIARAIDITRRVPVDIRISGPAIDWASDSEFPEIDELDFDNQEVLSDAAGAWLGQLGNAEFAQLGDHRFLRIGRGDHAIIVSSPKIADSVETRALTPIIVGVGLSLVLLAYLAVRWLFSRSVRSGTARRASDRAASRSALRTSAVTSSATWPTTSTGWLPTSRACSTRSASCCSASVTSCERRFPGCGWRSSCWTMRIEAMST